MPRTDSRRRFPLEFEVLDANWVTPCMRRVVVGGAASGAASPPVGPEDGSARVSSERDQQQGDRFDAFLERDNGFTDRYVKLVFLRPDVDYPRPLDTELVRETLPSDAWPVLRTYTVRRIDRAARTLTIDFVVHGDEGVAGPWAARARAGDRIHLIGPGGAYAPATEPDWHLVVGDDAALPAVAAALEAMPPGRPVHAFIEVDGPQDEQPIRCDADLRLTWLHRDGAAPGSTGLLAEAVRTMDWPSGRAQVFVHGESALLKALRSYLRDERGVDRADLSISGYWRRGANEEGFREWKSAQAERQAKVGVA